MKNAGVAAAVKQLREHLGESQQKFANRLGLAVSSVARYDAGNKPDMPVLLKMAAVAQDHDRLDLAGIFHRAVNDEVGGVAYREATNANLKLLKAMALLMRSATPDVSEAITLIREASDLINAMDPFHGDNS